jgi:choline-glycine betaine transporter
MLVCYGPPMSTSPTPIDSTELDRPVFFVSLVLLLVVTGILLLDPTQRLAQLQGVHHFMTHDLGWLFLGFVFVGLIWLGWLAASRHGKTVLGDPEKGPTYSNISWFGMLFCAGIGSNLL